VTELLKIVICFFKNFFDEAKTRRRATIRIERASTQMAES